MAFLNRLVARFGLGRAQRDAALGDLRRQLGEAVAQGRGDAVLALCDAILRRAPNDGNALRAAAVTRLKTGDVERAAAHFARLEEIASDGARTVRLLRESFMDPVRADRGEPYVATLDDALVDTAYWSVICGDRIFTRETQARTVSNSPFVMGRVSPDRTHCIMTVPRAPQRIDTPCVLLGSDYNYAHWVLRNVLKLSLLENFPLPDDARFLVRDDLRRWQKQYLDLLGIPEARLLRVPVDSVVACRSLTVPTQLRNHPRMADGIAWLRAKLAPQLAPPEAARALIYASRREQGARRLLNEAQVETALAELGFEIIVPGEMSVREQIAAFSRARIVVAPHGAATANMVFAPPGATLVELLSAAILHMGEIRFLCKAAGQYTRAVVSHDIEAAPAPGAGPEMHRDYRIDIDALRAELRGLLGGG